MILNCGIVLTSAIVEVALAKSPVTTTTNETTTIHIEYKSLAIVGVIHLTHTNLECLRIRNLACNSKLEACIIEMLLTIAIWPPELQWLRFELRELLRTEAYGTHLTSLQCYALLELNIADIATQNTLHSICRGVANDNFRDKGCQSIRQSKFCLHEWVFECNLTCCGDIYIVIDTHITTTNSRDPIPTNRSVECRVIGTKYTAILIGALEVLLLNRSEVLVLDNLHCENILAIANIVGNIELATKECTVNATKIFAIEEYLRLPVDTVEVECKTLLGISRRHLKLGAIPEVRHKVALRNLEEVIRIVRLWNSTYIAEA